MSGGTGPSPVASHLAALRAGIRCGGRARRRLLTEARDHLADAVAVLGEAEAVRRFGSPTDLALAFDTEQATRRTTHAVLATVVGVGAVALSTLALLQHADPSAHAVVPWAVVFFGCAQAAGVGVLLAGARALHARRSDPTPQDLVLTARSCVVAQVSALTTLVAAGGAVPGRGGGAEILAGPLVGLATLAPAVRAWRLARSVRRRSRAGSTRPVPLASRPALADPRGWPLVVLGAALTAWAWDRADQGGAPLAVAGTEAGLVVTGLLILGPALGLWSMPGDRPLAISLRSVPARRERGPR